MSWQGTISEAFSIADFAVDWDRQVARCPEGKESVAWASYSNSQRPHRCALVQVRFHPNNCRACPSRARCTRSAPTRGRNLTLYPRREHEVLMAARARERTDEYRTLYAQRQGIEGTISQGVRAFGLRQARYPRPGQNGVAACRDRRCPQPRPNDGMARQTPARTHPHLTLRCNGNVTGDFANSVGSIRKKSLCFRVSWRADVKD